MVQGGHGQECTPATQIFGVKVLSTGPMSPREHTSPSEADTLPGNAAEYLETADLEHQPMVLDGERLDPGVL